VATPGDGSYGQAATIDLSSSESLPALDKRVRAGLICFPHVATWLRVAGGGSHAASIPSLWFRVCNLNQLRRAGLGGLYHACVPEVLRTILLLLPDWRDKNR